MTVAEALRVSRFFGDLSPWDLETVKAMMLVKHYAAGEALVTEGEPAEALFLLLEGKLTVTARDGARYYQQTVEPGETVGFMCLIDPRPHEIGCTAAENATVALLSRAAFDMLRSAGAHIAFHLQACIFRHLQRELLLARSALVREAFGMPGGDSPSLPHVVA